MTEEDQGVENPALQNISRLTRIDISLIASAVKDRPTMRST
jgi:hypothetical protein